VTVAEMNLSNYQGRPVILFPDGWADGWVRLEDGTFPITIAEAYLAGVARPKGQRSTYPFTKVADLARPDVTTNRRRPGWAGWRELYYEGGATCPFGYSADGKPLAPHGVSKHGVPRLHPQDE
jgi:hypothetical protein